MRSPRPTSTPRSHAEAALRRSALLPALLLTLVTGTSHAANETPKRLNAVIFAPHPSGVGIAGSIENYLCAEHYTVEKHLFGGVGTPTLAKLKEIAAGGYAVLVIIAHGSRGGITVEDCATRAEAIDKCRQYQNDPANSWISENIEWGAVRDEEDDNDRPMTRYSVDLDTRGVSKLFGGTDANRSIVMVLACHSWEMQNATPNQGTFGATEFLGCSGSLSPAQRGRAKAGLAAMGGIEGIAKRPVAPAFAGRLQHLGPGNTTLAPACTHHLPANDAVLPRNQKTPGSTTYETSMDIANVDIMEPSGCRAVVTDQAWNANRLDHTFKVEPRAKGRLVLKVKPTVAVSRNNDQQLVGNLYLPDTIEEPERREVNECQFGQSGLDGLKPCVAPEIPYRWCVWCGEAPAQPTRPKKPVSMGDPSTPRRVPAREQDAFVLFQDDPGPGNTFTVAGQPWNLSFLPMADWYGHVIFTPDDAQVGQQFAVTFATQDEGGPREQRTLLWEVVPRVNALALGGLDPELPAGDLGIQATRPGETAAYGFRVQNTGNTVIEELTLSSPGLLGPEDVPVVMTPASWDVLMPGDQIEVTVLAAAHATQPSGAYAGTLTVTGRTADGPLTASGAYRLAVNRPPSIAAPAETLRVTAGAPVLVPLAFADPEGDSLDTYLDLAPFGGALNADGAFEWTPPAEAVGVRTFSIVAEDAWDAAAHSLVIEVLGTAGVTKTRIPFPFAFALGPSPARAAVSFALTLERPAAVGIDVFDPHGRRVSRPVDERVEAGRKSWTWRPERLAGGLYFVRLTVDGESDLRRLVWLGSGEP